MLIENKNNILNETCDNKAQPHLAGDKPVSYLQAYKHIHVYGWGVELGVATKHKPANDNSS